MKTKTIMQYILPFVAVATIAASEGKAGQIEEVVMPQAKTTDVKVGGSIGKGFGYFSRARMKDDGSYFGLVDITKSLKYGFDGLFEVQEGTGMDMTPRLGLQRFQQIGPFGVYTAATHTLKGSPSIEAVVSAEYARKIAKKVTARFFAEAVAGEGLASDPKGLDYAIARLRAGLQYKAKDATLEGGPAVDLSQGSKPTIGAYARISF